MFFQSVFSSPLQFQNVYEAWLCSVFQFNSVSDVTHSIRRHFLNYLLPCLHFFPCSHIGNTLQSKVSIISVASAHFKRFQLIFISFIYFHTLELHNKINIAIEYTYNFFFGRFPYSLVAQRYSMFLYLPNWLKPLTVRYEVSELLDNFWPRY